MFRSGQRMIGLRGGNRCGGSWAGLLEERGGFEPPDPFGSPVFKTGAISQTLPSLRAGGYAGRDACAPPDGSSRSPSGCVSSGLPMASMAAARDIRLVSAGEGSLSSIPQSIAALLSAEPPRGLEPTLTRLQGERIAVYALEAWCAAGPVIPGGRDGCPCRTTPNIAGPAAPSNLDVGAPSRIRTGDLSLTMGTLYQLSYQGAGASTQSRTGGLPLTRGTLYQLSYRGGTPRNPGGSVEREHLVRGVAETGSCCVTDLGQVVLFGVSDDCIEGVTFAGELDAAIWGGCKDVAFPAFVPCVGVILYPF